MSGSGTTERVNGFYRPVRAFENGVYTPLITPMTSDGQVNLPALGKQVVRLADAGMGIVLLGTNGEGEPAANTDQIDTSLRRQLR